MEHNPATGIKVDVGKVKEKKRLPYSVEDLNLIFRFPIFTEGARPRGGAGEAAKWLPILALFTGARLRHLLFRLGKRADERHWQQFRGYPHGEEHAY